MRAFIVAFVVTRGLAVAAYADDKKQAGAAKGAAVGALAGNEVGNGHVLVFCFQQVAKRRSIVPFVT